jgi:hypothetical protein
MRVKKYATGEILCSNAPEILERKSSTFHLRHIPPRLPFRHIDALAASQRSAVLFRSRNVIAIRPPFMAERLAHAAVHL